MKKFFGHIIGYFRESLVELSKVVWPTRKQVLEMTLAVLILAAFIATLLGVFDYGLQEALKQLLKLK
ncbi:MAG: preprotein translocase subunit SecE [bacterium]